MTNQKIPGQRPSERALSAADQQMQHAKRAFSAAALACLRGNLDAAAQVRAALTSVDQARATLRELSDRREEEG